MSVIFPPFCRYCKRFLADDAVFCAPCAQLIQPMATVDMPITQNFSCRVFAVSDYKDPVRSLILAKTYGDITAAVQLGKLILEYTPITQCTIDLVIPIPLHWRRFAKRGYNQAHEMAKVIARHASIPCIAALKRARATAYQAPLSVHERIANVADVFSVKSAYHTHIHGKHIAIVDDLLTTGSTMKSAIKALRKYKPASITIVVACRVAQIS